LGLPVVATAVGGVPEAVRDGVEGVLVPSGDPDALADAITELATDPDRRERMGRAARERADAFGAEHAVRRIEAIYDEVRARRQGAVSR
jgi:glycosyltransferase involved in cell wall biosynthesis